MEKQQLAGVAVDRIEKVFGEHPEYRRAHARGVIYEAIFSANGLAKEYTTAPHLQGGEIKAVARFSHSSPDPTWTDIMSPVKGLAVQFQLPEGEITNIVGVNSPIFLAKTPEAFTKILGIVTSFKRGKPRLRELAKLLIQYPESRAAIKVIKKMHAPASFATGRYHSIHAFYFIDQEGKRIPIKYEWEPDAGMETLSPKDAGSLPFGYYEWEIEDRLQKEPVSFRLNIVLGEEGDPTADPTIAWPKDRRKVTIGQLTLTQLAERADSLKFDPTVVTEGIECSEDQILNFRRAAYSISHERRNSEK
ncbi:catalase family peroxidase [Planococcus shenhongbingii]|uniref:Catalase-related peroxidase n=1 Tax=Planococcus shenhongbingii TaxID=3058398 RepID=A0ABT8NFR3_9BACL|nr:catalase family peroxidase [Planococcus sp. N017]MDN7246736.1 catalase family peroxidase [Planococcus sp. N017]